MWRSLRHLLAKRKKKQKNTHASGDFSNLDCSKPFSIDRVCSSQKVYGFVSTVAVVVVVASERARIFSKDILARPKSGSAGGAKYPQEYVVVVVVAEIDRPNVVGAFHKHTFRNYIIDPPFSFLFFFVFVFLLP
jgi:hypothetical protein